MAATPESYLADVVAQLPPAPMHRVLACALGEVAAAAGVADDPTLLATLRPLARGTFGEVRRFERNIARYGRALFNLNEQLGSAFVAAYHVTSLPMTPETRPQLLFEFFEDAIYALRDAQRLARDEAAHTIGRCLEAGADPTLRKEARAGFERNYAMFVDRGSFGWGAPPGPAARFAATDARVAVEVLNGATLDVLYLRAMGERPAEHRYAIDPASFGYHLARLALGQGTGGWDNFAPPMPVRVAKRFEAE